MDINRRSNSKTPFEIGLKSDNSGKLILTDEANAILKYTAKVTAPTVFDPLFVSALSLSIAAKVAVPLTNKESKITNIIRNFDRVIATAKAENKMEHIDDEEPESSFVTSRY